MSIKIIFLGFEYRPIKGIATNFRFLSVLVFRIVVIYGNGSIYKCIGTLIMQKISVANDFFINCERHIIFCLRSEVHSPRKLLQKISMHVSWNIFYSRFILQNTCWDFTRILSVVFYDKLEQ